MTDNTLPLKSPVGTIRFFRVGGKGGDKERDNNALRLEVDGNTPGAAEFKKQLLKINKNLVVEDEDKLSKTGNYIFNARSKEMPRVYDKSNTRLESEEIPMISEGTAQAIVTQFTGEKGGGINLVGIKLIDYTVYQGGGISDDDLEAALRS